MYLIIGAGLAGSVMANRIAAVLKKNVLLIDRRDHIAGNAFDFKNDEGILIQKHGPHIFHTNDEQVWNYLKQFTDWIPYFHRVKAIIDGNEINIPINFESIKALFPATLAIKIETALVKKFISQRKVTILELMQSKNKYLRFLSDFLYNNLYYYYSQKQWGIAPELLDSTIFSRVPVYLSYDNRYFQDRYQAMPENGYTEMVKKMLDYPRIKIELNTGYKDIAKDRTFKKIIFTGCLDEFFNFRYGILPYRSMKFVYKKYSRKYFQSAAVINYPNEFDFTRITEFKYFLNSGTAGTEVAFEYPGEYQKDINEPYYPLPAGNAYNIHNKYIEETKKINNVLFIGRLAEYKYYNMDQVVKQALCAFTRHLMVP